MQIFQVKKGCRGRLSCASGHADITLGKVDQLLPCRALNNSVYVCLTRQLTKAKNPDYAEDFPRQALVKTWKKAVQYVLFKEQGTTNSIPSVALWQLLMLYGKLSAAADKNSTFHHNNTAHKRRQEDPAQISSFKGNNLPSWTVGQMFGFFFPYK